MRWWEAGASLGCQGCSSLVTGERAGALKSFRQGTEVLGFSFREYSSEAGELSGRRKHKRKTWDPGRGDGGLGRKRQLEWEVEDRIQRLEKVGGSLRASPLGKWQERNVQEGDRRDKKKLSLGPVHHTALSQKLNIQRYPQRSSMFHSQSIPLKCPFVTWEKGDR